MRSGYLAQKVVKKDWAELTSATIVDIRKVSDTWSSYYYLVKYLSKLHQKDWTERHVSYSRGFFNPADTEKMLFPELEQIERSPLHPFRYLNEKFMWFEIKERREACWELPHKPPSESLHVDDSEVGLGPTQPLEYQPPPAAQLLPGMEDSAEASYYDYEG